MAHVKLPAHGRKPGGSVEQAAAQYQVHDARHTCTGVVAIPVEALHACKPRDVQLAGAACHWVCMTAAAVGHFSSLLPSARAMTAHTSVPTTASVLKGHRRGMHPAGQSAPQSQQPQMSCTLHPIPITAAP